MLSMKTHQIAQPIKPGSSDDGLSIDVKRLGELPGSCHLLRPSLSRSLSCDFSERPCLPPPPGQLSFPVLTGKEA
jgi:hypothetical protein